MPFVINQIRNCNADIAIISEANLGVLKPDQLKHSNEYTKDYYIESHTLPNDSASRIVSFIKHGIEHSRVHEAENDINASIVLKVKISQKSQYL